MRKNFGKLLGFILISLFIMNSALGLNNEYKNSLDKIEVVKTSQDAYSINLYTSKSYSEPAKVIKKSDYNYYILLPETKNNVRNTITNPDIASIDANSYNYATDTNNGYVKINITTTRPLNLKVNTQTAAKSQKTTVASAPQKTKTSEPVNLRKVSQNQIAKTNTVETRSERQKPRENAKLAYNNNQNSLKQTQEQLRLKQNKASLNKEIPVAKKNKAYKEENLEKMKTKEELAKEIPAKLNLSVPQEIDKEEIEKTFNEWQNNEVEDVGEDIPIETVAQNPSEEEPELNLSEIKNLIKKNINLILLCLALLFFLVFLAIPKRKERPKRASELNSQNQIAKTNQPMGAEVSIDENEVQQEAQPQIQSHFIPARENAEKSTNYGMRIEPYTGIIEEEIEESVLDEVYTKAPETQAQQVQPQQIQAQPVQEPTPTPAPAQNTEPVVLSTAQIAQNRGFMCVSYNGSIRFMGYIDDNVFALHNFKKAELKNNAIKFRLTERTQTGASFIVKVDDIKLIVAVGKNTMKLEMAL